MPEISLVSANEYTKDIAVKLIGEFWRVHNNYAQSLTETLTDYAEWTSKGHIFYLIKANEEFIGFAHLGSRGARIDWLEDLFILPAFQKRGLGGSVIALLESKVKEYSDSMYLEVASRNLGAMRLYRKLGYDCLNTVTIRKDFHKEKFKTVGNEILDGMNFEIRKYKET